MNPFAWILFLKLKNCLQARQDVRELTPTLVSSPSKWWDSEVCFYMVSSFHMELSFNCPQHRWLHKRILSWLPSLPYSFTLSFQHLPVKLLVFPTLSQGLLLGDPNKTQVECREVRRWGEVRFNAIAEELGIWLGWHSLKPGTLGQ
jgi:hypothetical protein